jgi:hypothetical protein
MFYDLVEPLPIGGVLVAFAVLALLMYELGFRVGRWWQNRTPEEAEGPTSMLVGSILALLAFLLAITMGMAADRFDTRRGLVVAESNAIGTSYLRAEYLAEPASSTSRELLREYTVTRIVQPGITEEAVLSRLAQGQEILDELWAIAVELAREAPESEMLGLYVESLNETIDVYSTRNIAGIFARVPEAVMLLLYVGAILALGMVGFNAGLTRRRSPLSAVVLIIVLGAVTTLIVDIDRPQGGNVTVSQQPMEALAAQIAAPPE